MEFIPISTRIFIPPEDDIYLELRNKLANIKEKDIVLITSKVVSIHEGRCVPINKFNKKDLVEKEAEYIYEVPETGRKITVTRNAFLGGSGIDESNGSGHYILLPKDSYESAKKIHRFLTEKFNINNLGVVITDTHSMPLRYGAFSVSVGCWGFEPIEYHTGKEDLFKRKLIYSKTNIVDALAAAATLVSGECAEATPIVIARNIPNVKFTNDDPREEIFVDLKNDRYKSIFNQFRKGGRNI